jgi:hypothetical protein
MDRRGENVRARIHLSVRGTMCLCLLRALILAWIPACTDFVRLPLNTPLHVGASPISAMCFLCLGHASAFVSTSAV